MISEARVFGGPSLSADPYFAVDLRTPFEVTLQDTPSLPTDLVDFIKAFVPSELSAQLGNQEVSQMIAQLERLNYELLRGVEEIRQARVLPQIKISVLGSVRLQREKMLDLCDVWTEGRRVCRYMSGLAAYYLWVHLCGSLQYPPLINWACSVWPQHLFEDIHTYEKQLGFTEDVSNYFA